MRRRQRHASDYATLATATLHHPSAHADDTSAPTSLVRKVCHVLHPPHHHVRPHSSSSVFEQSSNRPAQNDMACLNHRALFPVLRVFIYGHGGWTRGSYIP
ncbi:hypothetical protein P171DRAFT_435187 [Karstenula rhodostoma CBS 690.94]|uniref:Uncharacterized protein n=1 Tax=Karstenula rhodostoma CBS 690.94 TaxID=1392251 RepID=A0A9P4PAP6_9PLEO|nr:hypothetical protein P171DRAFT_435187 [Karstenula rhodostoma CBS 690.94]